jgi:hypothetical protein
MEPRINYNESMIDWAMWDEQQDAAFYTVTGIDEIASVDYKNRTLSIVATGEMYLTIPDVPEHLDMSDDEVYNQDWEETVVRYTSDLFKLGIDTDEKLRELDERFSKKGYQIWHMNPWFELFSPTHEDFGWEVYDDPKEAIKAAVKFIQEDEYWDNLHSPESYVV